MEEATIETFTATPSASPPPPTSVGANVVSSAISGHSTQKLPGQSPKNAKMAADTTETSTATPSADPPHPASVTPTIAASTTAVTLFASFQENPNVQRDKPDQEPESDQGDCSIDPKTPKYKVGTFVLKELDNVCCAGVIHRVVLEKKSFLYSVKLNEVDIKEGIIDDEIDQFGQMNGL
jgi:hypothetical protein